MGLEVFKRNRILRTLMYKSGKNRAEEMFNRIKPFLNKDERILDIGSGSCNICEILKDKGYNVKPLDVKNLSFVEGIEPVIYDGKRIPYKDNSFDKAIIVTVLHHTPEPKAILKEAKRVSKEIIVIEDIYSNIFHKYLTYFLDSLLNLEFRGHPHSNKKDKLWKKTFKNLKLKLVNSKYKYSLLFIKQATYYLKL